MRLLYPYGEEFTGKRAREVHSIHRAHSLAEAGLDVSFVLAQSPRFPDAKTLLEAFALAPHPRLAIAFLPRRLRFGPFSFVSTKIFYRALSKWLDQQTPFDLAYAIHLKAADHLQSNKTGLPLVFEAHEIFADSFEPSHSKHKALTALESKVYLRATALAATSNYLLNSLRERYPLPDATLVLPNSVAPSFFSIPLGQAEANRLIYVGSFQPWKGVDIALEAMRLLPQHHLHLFGGSLPAMPPNVTCHGFASHAQIAPELAKASLALIPNRLTPKSSLYTFPMKLLEYAAAGRQVVASDLPVIRELNLGPWATIVPPENPEALAAAIQNAVLSPTLQNDARAWAGNFTWTKAANQLVAFFGKISDNREK